MASNEGLSIWTIYYNSIEYPGQYVVRRWLVGTEPVMTEDFHLVDSLDEARRLIPPGLIPMQRWEGDDPCVVESWM